MGTESSPTRGKENNQQLHHGHSEWDYNLYSEITTIIFETYQIYFNIIPQDKTKTLSYIVSLLPLFVLFL